MNRGRKKIYSTFDDVIPSIVDVKIRTIDESINVKIQSKQKSKSVKATKQDDKIKDSKDVKKEVTDKEEPYRIKVHAVGKYNFKDKNVAVCLYANGRDWNLVSITGSYDYRKLQICENQFEEITGNDFVYNIVPVGDTIKAKVFKFDVSKIYRHVLMKTFTLNVSYNFLDVGDKEVHTTKYAFEVPYFRTETRLESKFLGHFSSDPRITSLYNHKFRLHPGLTLDEEKLLRELDRYQKTDPTERDFINSTKIIKYALNIEDLASQDNLKGYILKNVKIDEEKRTFEDRDEPNQKTTETCYSFAIKKKELPPNFEEMSLCFVPMTKFVEGRFNNEEDSIYSQVKTIENNRIYFDKKPPKPEEKKPTINLKLTYAVRFVPNRISFRSCFQALDTIKNNNLTRYFDKFEDAPFGSRKNNGEKIENFQWFNKSIETNEEQKTAVTSIVNCTAYPFPYVVFGPPGTGKTSVIVESIAQIIKKNPRSRIMVTAQSNSACDEVGDRLLKHISPCKIFRLYSPSLLNPENGETSWRLRRTSNLRNKRNQYPTKEELFHFKVVIVTLMTCSRLVQFDVEDMMKRHFDYIFLDEAAAAMEPEAYVPIVGLGTGSESITTNIVLLGDHKQLGAVVSSDIASRLGLGESLMERIMSKRRYRMNEVDKSYDKNYVTQLLDNFRSHPAILQFSNVLFYESKLRAKLGEPEKSLGTRWNFLNNKRFPILFHCCKTPSKIERGGTSSFNEGEIKLIRFYVDSLIKVGIDGVKIAPEDIGIVSPYKAQLTKIRQRLRHQRNVEIGTAEYYQGREKKIIIISTVKSHDYVGFLKSEKRLNVCITRAKSLLILIGNADTLQQSSLWNSFMHFCKANDGCCGDEFELKRLTDEEQKILDKVNSVMREMAKNESIDTKPAVDMAAQLKAIEERMEKVKILTQKF